MYMPLSIFCYFPKVIQIKSKVLCKTNVPTFVPTLGTYFCAYFNIVNFPMYGGFQAKAT